MTSHSQPERAKYIAKIEDSREFEPRNRVPEHMVGYLLRFRDPDLEQRYQEDMNTVSLRRDVVFTLFYLLQVVAGYQSLDTLTAWSAFNLINGVISVVLLYLQLSHRPLYLKHRVNILVGLRLMMILVYIPAMWLHEENLLPIAVAAQGFNQIQLMSFKVLLIGAAVLGYRLPMHRSVWLIVISLAAAAASNIKRCTVECQVPLLVDRYELLAVKLDNISRLTPYPLGTSYLESSDTPFSAVTSCWMVHSLVQIVLGGVIPTMIAAAEEEHSRLEFAALEGGGSAFFPGLKHLAIFSLLLMIPYTLVIIQGLRLVAVILQSYALL